MQALNLEQARFNMIEQQIRPWDVLDQRVLETLQTVPREAFVPEDQQDLAFMDIEIPIGHGESMLAPKIEGRILQALDIRPTDSVLEIGAGVGYLTACLAKLASAVFSVDIHEDLTARARENLAAQSIRNVTLWTGDAAYGWDKAPAHYDVIVVSGSLPEYDDCFERQLKAGGRLFVVVGQPPAMEAQLITHVDNEAYSRVGLFETVLKPLVGREPKQAFHL